MDKINDGGRAFPSIIGIDFDRNSDNKSASIYCNEGMSIRDWFAGMALTAILSTRQEKGSLANKQYGENYRGEREYFAESNADWYAKEAYIMADAMIKARDKQHE
jgi:hypothetical protein